MTIDHPRWLVLKFGGTSVSSAANWATIARVVRDRLEDGYRPLVVHSALSGVTERLETLASRALAREHAAVMAEIDELHDTLASELGLESDEIGALLSEDRNELRGLVEGVAAGREVTPRTRARLLAFGERMATRIGTAYLQLEGIPVTWMDARDVLTSVDTRNASEPSSYLSAKCDAAADAALAARLNEADGVPVTQGFTASNAYGRLWSWAAADRTALPRTSRVSYLPNTWRSGRMCPGCSRPTRTSSRPLVCSGSSTTGRPRRSQPQEVGSSTLAAFWRSGIAPYPFASSAPPCRTLRARSSMAGPQRGRCS